ncbi:hypothetical protein Pla108_10360 [Botrimarina colliarenosi]|uniref:Lipid/polyisoprenoid-binding YceI-like domain-containing protein n=1 Tax=Botrimarina colliarenosi TaxID=2528001 RepID=A0A5C6AM62_9BACT|nr:YceI family protein [Botrimarina colliarenosi]TWU00092.1 hypothetical protein Pla108_10360 [Botrimarina colliarenosi]
MRANPLTIAAAAVFAVGQLATPSARAESFGIDPAHTSAVFSISHLGYSYTYGMFREASGTVEFDKDDPAVCQFQFAINAASLDTMNEKRDEHLRGADFFNVKQFPQITFESSSVEKTTGADGKAIYNVTGTLTMHGESREVTLPMEYLGEGSSPFNDYRVGFLCQTTLKRSDFGMEFMVGPIGDNVGVTVSFEAVRK